ATFWDLNLLSIGDQIIYQAPDGQQSVFIVEETGLYPWDQIPLEKVFSRTGDPRISLITCGGLWSRQYRNYSHRTLVFARISN
ncbi:MAG: class F sortase, partial [Anaerolineales bacterium]|nr:class F sortase [Anaerolineales bacterium]